MIGSRATAGRDGDVMSITLSGNECVLLSVANCGGEPMRGMRIAFYYRLSI